MAYKDNVSIQLFQTNKRRNILIWLSIFCYRIKNKKTSLSDINIFIFFLLKFKHFSVLCLNIFTCYTVKKNKKKTKLHIMIHWARNCALKSYSISAFSSLWYQLARIDPYCYLRIITLTLSHWLCSVSRVSSHQEYNVFISFLFFNLLFCLNYGSTNCLFSTLHGHSVYNNLSI